MDSFSRCARSPLRCFLSLRCTGVATQDPGRARGLVVADKAERVQNFHRATLETLAEITAAAGLDHPGDFTLAHLARRVSQSETSSFEDLYPALAFGELLTGAGDARFARAWLRARPDSFQFA